MAPANRNPCGVTLLLAAVWALVVASTALAEDRKDEIFGGGRDFYPLGVLGVIGSPVAGGFRVFEVRPWSPATFPGLQAGDVIRQVQGAPLGNAPWIEIGLALEALRCAEGQPAPPLVVAVEREGVGGEPETIEYRFELARRPPHAQTCPFACGACSALRDAALAWLVEQQERDGSFPTRLGGPNGHCVVTSMALLALLADGETGKGGKHAAVIKAALAFLRKEAGEDPLDKRLRRQGVEANWNQTNWAHSWSGIAAGLLHQRHDTASTKSILQESVRRLVASQEQSGGWAHGPGGINALGYKELMIVGGYSLTALGLARQCGLEVPEQTVQAALGYIDGCILPAGGVGYGPGTVLGGVPDAARAAAAILAFDSLGLHDDERRTALAKWLTENTALLENSHQGYLLQLATTALAIRQIGVEPYREFYLSLRANVMLCQCGKERASFTTRPTSESLGQRLSNDIALGEAWATAVYALLVGLASDNAPTFRPR